MVGEPAAYATGSPGLKAVGPCYAVSNSPITKDREHAAGADRRLGAQRETMQANHEKTPAFTIAFQPIVMVEETAEIGAHEALVRCPSSEVAHDGAA